MAICPNHIGTLVGLVGFEKAHPRGLALWARPSSPWEVAMAGRIGITLVVVGLALGIPSAVGGQDGDAEKREVVKQLMAIVYDKSSTEGVFRAYVSQAMISGRNIV